ncbi:SulP family inorganic anion transporter [Streptomyces hydrogenans]|uniref:SulP family inorganic anion transporter n=1 Tax=Streptomyces hydrogenans TaxID=1873719 RepID=UPI003800B972
MGELVRDIAAIPSTPPSFTAPDLTAAPDLSAAPHLLRGAASVALVALAQAVGIAPSLPDPDGTRSDINGDFRSQGYANLAGGLFQALPSGGSTSRTGVAVSAGARTRWAGVVSGVFLALVVLLCGSLAERIPMPVVGGLILVVGDELIRGKRHDILRVLRTSWMSAGATVLTFVATTRLPLQQAVILGAALSLILSCAQAARQAKLVALVRADDGHWRTAEPAPALPPSRPPARRGHRPRLRGIVVLRRAAPASRPSFPPRRGPRRGVDSGGPRPARRPALGHDQTSRPVRPPPRRPGRPAGPLRRPALARTPPPALRDRLPPR